ncbi:MAG: spore cortex biosynthesis protein YabQ [Clostridia bacterium]|nr:spore cortex biosynthesis protein YabQ [Clostridia bacterium]
MVTSQANLFFIFTIIGVAIAVIFDIFRIMRKSFKTSDIVTYIEDILFWLITGFIILYAIFKFNNGEIRFFMFVGMILGATFYMLLISRYIVKFSVKIILTIKKIVNTILQIIIKPLKFIYKITLKPIRQKIEKSMKNFKIKRENM